MVRTIFAQPYAATVHEQHARIVAQLEAASRSDLASTAPVSAKASQRTTKTANIDGAFMEPSRRNYWQSAANPSAGKTAESSQNRCHGLPPVALEL
jgi:hypothetical protein